MRKLLKDSLHNRERLSFIPWTRIETWATKHWLVVGTALTMIFQLMLLGFRFAKAGYPPIDLDAALFQHAGWYITQGAIPYVHIWDPKPPLVVQTTAILALFANGNMLTLHFLSSLMTISAMVGVVYLVSKMAFELTESRVAAVIAALTLFALPIFWRLPSLGFRPKYFTLLFGLAGIYFQMKRRPFLSGAAVVASTAYWLLGAIFVPIVLGLAVQGRGRKQISRTLLGQGVVVLAVLVPIVIWGATGSMITEVILVPLMVPEDQTFFLRLIKFFGSTGLASLVYLAGLCCLAIVGFTRMRKFWWLALGAGWFLAQVLFFDFDSSPDLLPLTIFAGFGAATLVASWTRAKRWALLLSLVLLVFANPLVIRVASDLVQISRPQSASVPASAPEGDASQILHIYWSKSVPDSCHYRLSAMEVDWIEKTGGDYDKQECGKISWSDLMRFSRQ